MIRGTTPTLTFKIKTDLDFDEVSKFEITFKSVSGTKERTWDENNLGIDPVEKQLTLTLSQEETLYFNVGEIDIQLRVKLNNDMVYASNVVTSTLDKILREGVI